eukprot:GHVL01010036.1.p2 GENE.GHVL01010036.1~~GHVL01010036.1.p2  ORF type:complete len:151 (-),score=25.40 GHVL01010036.1:245-697(-)
MSSETQPSPSEQEKKEVIESLEALLYDNTILQNNVKDYHSVVLNLKNKVHELQSKIEDHKLKETNLQSFQHAYEKEQDEHKATRDLLKQAVNQNYRLECLIRHAIIVENDDIVRAEVEKTLLSIENTSLKSLLRIAEDAGSQNFTKIDNQ